MLAASDVPQLTRSFFTRQSVSVAARALVEAEPPDEVTRAKRHALATVNQKPVSKVARHRSLAVFQSADSQICLSRVLNISRISDLSLLRTDSTRKDYVPLNLDRIQHWIDQGRLSSSPENPITARELLHSKCVHDVKAGIKLLASVCINCPSKYCLPLICGSSRVHNSSRHPSSSNPRKRPRRQSGPSNKTAVQ